MCSLTVLEARSKKEKNKQKKNSLKGQNQSVGRADLPLEKVRVECVCLPFLLRELPCFRSLAHGSFLMSQARVSIVTSPSSLQRVAQSASTSFLQGDRDCIYGPPDNLGQLTDLKIFNLVSAKSLCHIKECAQVPGTNTWISWGTIIQPITPA